MGGACASKKEVEVCIFESDLIRHGLLRSTMSCHFEFIRLMLQSITFYTQNSYTYSLS